MGYAEGLDHVLDRSASFEDMSECNHFSAGREKVVEFRVEPEISSTHLGSYQM
jgi:hypothetical protein